MLWWHVWACAWIKSGGAQGTIPCWKQCEALCVVWYLIWSRMFMQHLHLWKLCMCMCVTCSHGKFVTAVHSERRSPTVQWKVILTEGEERWVGGGGGEGMRVGRLESSPCSLWQSEQEALSKVSVHSQKAAAELQATAWWLHHRGQREQRSTGKGNIRNSPTHQPPPLPQSGDGGSREGWKWGGDHCSSLPLGDECEPSLSRGGIAHHLAADWDCAAMIMWEGPLSALCCWPIPASTDIAMASAAALELRPFCPAEGLCAKELCWITGAGEPVGSELSFMLSSAAM